MPDYLSGEFFELRECRSCGLVFTDPQPTPSEMGRYYPSAYYRWRGERSLSPMSLILRGWQLARDERNRDVLSRFRRSGAILDVGCGRGDDLSFFCARGWEVAGTELGDGSGLPDWLRPKVFLGDLREAPWPEASFDCVTFWHSLEHTPDFAEQLAAARRFLRPGGWLFVEVPNLDSWQARAFGGDWFHLDPPRHLFHFRPDVLDRSLRDLGFCPTRRNHFSYEYELFGWIQSAETRLLGTPNRLYANLKAGKVDAEQLGLVALGGALAALFLPVAVVAAWARGGATMRFVARLGEADAAR